MISVREISLWGVGFGFVALLTLLPGSSAGITPHFPFPRWKSDKGNDAYRVAQTNGDDYEYETHFFMQTLDHFSFGQPMTFPQRYLVNTDHWKPGQPIFMYCGNEGDIVSFAINSGFMWEIAEEFGAMLLFPEHRYYGQSLPFGADSLANVTTRAFLTSEQALADFALLVTSLKSNRSSEASPVVAFGGSYGGMLAAWMRLKYPNVIVGALAASAPILQFEGITPPEVFYDITSNDYRMAGRECFLTINASWAEIRAAAARNESDPDAPGGDPTEEGLAYLTDLFHLCAPLEDVEDLIDGLIDAYVTLAMVNYPTAANFLMPLPAFPVQKVCRAMNQAPGSTLDKVVAGMQVYFNTSGQAACFDLDVDSIGADAGWDFQACTEMVMPMSSRAGTSMFPPFEWDGRQYARDCRKKYGVAPRPNWITTEFGGKNISEVLAHFGSNIIFSNGKLDPWSGGGVLKSISPSLVAITIDEGAHHLDLRASTSNDPVAVKEARDLERRYIGEWLAMQPAPGPRQRHVHREMKVMAGLVSLLITVALAYAGWMMYKQYRREQASSYMRIV